MSSVPGIRREERWPTAAFLVWQIILQALVIARYFPVFSSAEGNYRKTFIDGFHISGFDPLTYCVVSSWATAFDVNRHPLLAFFCYPLYVLNRALMELTGINCAQFVVGAVLLVCSVWAFVLMFRICKELIGTSTFEAATLSAMLFSFAHVMLAAVCPDHFVMSLFALLLTLYVSGKMMRDGVPMRAWQTVALFLLTAGISLNNGLKIILAALFVNGKRFFRLKFILPAVILPAIGLALFGEWEHETFVAESVRAAKIKRSLAVRAERDSLRKMFNDTTGIANDSARTAAFTRFWRAHRQKQLKLRAMQPDRANAGEPISRKRFLNWTDMTTSRTETLKENFFGESLQLHRRYLLGDVMRNRPVIVCYDSALNYIVEALLIVLFVLGAWMARRNRLMQTALSFLALDVLLHLVFGFGINEVYIMTAHWAYVIPLGMAFILPRLAGWPRIVMRTLLAALTLWLAIWNGTLLIEYLYQ